VRQISIVVTILAFPACAKDPWRPTVNSFDRVHSRQRRPQPTRSDDHRLHCGSAKPRSSVEAELGPAGAAHPWPRARRGSCQRCRVRRPARLKRTDQASVLPSAVREWAPVPDPEVGADRHPQATPAEALYGSVPLGTQPCPRPTPQFNRYLDTRPPQRSLPVLSRALALRAGTGASLAPTRFLLYRGASER
jgi:hypothetical protein